ncbi:putative membrane protein-like [Iris pallida]|uniref:Membrane protein-like n=1 Tax=Iris pallida TaxID=29817 RepID=A0AAX6GJZ1_IRIPA|nr:putative membrane protein-like [Iris pallida]
MLCSRKVMNFFLRKDVRKLLKRKDSDAGERGRALEDLRASLFNELRTPDGAKRLQQRVCGPTVALSFNFFVSVGIIMMNKLVLGKVGFNYPIFLTFIHYGLSWFLMAAMNAFSLLPASPPAKSTPFSSLLLLGIVMSLSNGLANVSLKYNSVGFYQMSKIAVTPTIVLAEFMLFKKRASYQKVAALTIVSVGVAVATVTDLEFHFFGACIALAWIVPSAVNKILWSNLQQQENWTALPLMWKTTPITLLFLVALMPWLDPPGVLSFNWNFPNTSAILMSAALGFLLQWSGALALGATSATSHVVLGQFKTCVILLGGFLIFKSNPGMTSICGAVTALGGMSLYTYLNLLGSKQQPAKLSTRQPSFPLSKSKLSKEGSDAHDHRNSAIESV